jgi:REP element-mobilizing transposase RayT
MGQTNRYFESGKAYEICLRVEEGMPFVCLQFIKLLLRAAMARASRDRRVTICHYLWMSNHLHILIVLHDGYKATQFYGELQKRLTDFMKRVLGKEKMTLWEGRPMVARLLDPAAVIARLSYFYANPSKANLIDRIDDYPGLSSWTEFQKADRIDSTFTYEIPWIRVPAIPKVGAGSITKREDRKLTAKLLKSARKKSILCIEPNAWMGCFGLKQEDVAVLNANCINQVRAAEKEARDLREVKGKKPKGAARLREEPIMRSHTPKKKERKIFVIGSDRKARIDYIEMVKGILGECRRLFLENLMHLWPPGVFRPSMRMRASVVDLS